MDKAEKKRLKAEAKVAKKRVKAEKKVAQKQLLQVPQSVEPAQLPTDKPSVGVRFAEAVKGIIYLIFAVTLLAAVLLGETGIIVTLDDVIGNLFAAVVGKVILAFVALALFIYGLKNLKIVK